MDDCVEKYSIGTNGSVEQRRRCSSPERECLRTKVAAPLALDLATLMVIQKIQEIYKMRFNAPPNVFIDRDPSRSLM